MKLLSSRTWWLACLSLIFLASCANVDDENPVLELVSPKDGQQVFVGSAFVVEMDLTDNEELSSYRIQIGSLSGLNWSEDITGDLSGKAQTVKTTINVATNAELGTYQMTVSCEDKEGNTKSEDLTLQVSPS